MNLPITPDTKVGALLEAYPELEEHLIACAPAFAKLRNPLLRRTVAKVATLEQAARVGGIGVRDLVRRLREAGFDDEGIVEIVAHVALNLFTNYVNVALNVPVDFPRVQLRRAA